MKFLADENFPLLSVQRLREANYDIVAIMEVSPGIKDREVLARGVSEKRVILTFDRDYGELVYRLGLKPPAGVLYFRYQPRHPLEPAQQILVMLQEGKLEFSGRFTVVEREQVRQRPLPNS